MVKGKMVVVVLLVVGLLFACSEVEFGGNGSGNVHASLPSGFELVSEDEISKMSTLRKLKEVETGCYYIFGRTWNGGGSSVSGSIEQMFIEKDGVTVPYCD